MQLIHPDPPIIACRKCVVLPILDGWIKGELLVKVLEKDLRTVKEVWGRRERKQEGVGAEKGPLRFDLQRGSEERRQNKGRDWERESRRSRAEGGGKGLYVGWLVTP